MTIMPIKMFRPLLLVIAIAMLSSSAYAQRQDDRSLSPYFFVQGDPAIDQLPLKNTNVEIAISGVIADVRVVQTYRNEGRRPINATYIFPASTRAAVYSMRMKIGDQVIVAKIKEREAAKAEFEAAKKEGKSASLLEENRPNVFSMKLANVMPQDQIDIELRYTELLVPTDGVYEVVYPTVVGPRYPSPESSNKPPVDAPYLHDDEGLTSTFHLSTRISAGVPIQDLNCTSHQIDAQWQGPSVAQLTLNGTDPFEGNRDFVLRFRLAGAQITSGLILYESEGENFFLYMAQPPQRVESVEIPAREFVFVVDVSGSMEGFPLDTTKQLLQDLIGNLRPTDYFNVVLFAGDSTVLSESPLQANPENVERALQLLSEQRGMGGTELLPALMQAMGLRREQNISRSIVLISDGYVSGEEGVFEHIRSNLNTSNVFSFGIGSSVNRYLMEGVAKAGMGEPFIVTNEAEAAAAAAKFREYIQSPVLTDISVRADGFETYDVFPARFPDLLAQRPLILFGKWRGPLTGTFELNGRTGRGDYSTSLDVASVQPAPENVALRYLWARNRISELSDYGSFGIASAESIKAITALGIEYNLLTRYTSFIAVREVIRNNSGSAEEVNQPLPLPVGVSDMAVGSEPELLWLFIASILIAVMVMLYRRLNPAAFSGPQGV